jgi:undecaprenyl diphosphate synthase
MAFNHGGRAEIVEAIRLIVAQGLLPEEVDESLVSTHLAYGDMPDPDLVVRTAGEQRLSNFMVWRCSYSELLFTDVLWPDFRSAHFSDALQAYSARFRKFGRVDGNRNQPSQ